MPPAPADAATEPADVVIIGAGAAGLTTAIFLARQTHRRSIVALDGAPRLGAKILVSGGGRCNVTHVAVTPHDYFGGSRNTIRRVLEAFTVEQTIALFAELGVRLHVEEGGKLFPDSNRARTVVDALHTAATRAGVDLRLEHRVNAIYPRNGHFIIDVRRRTAAGDVAHTLGARCVVLATGGRSLPRTGSDGAGYAFAQHLGHTLVPETPALVPLVLDGELHNSLAGVSLPVGLTVHARGTKPRRVLGPLLWTHFGISGPAVLDASRIWLRGQLEQRCPRLTVNFLPGEDFVTTEGRLLAAAAETPNAKVATVVSHWIPLRVTRVLLDAVGIPPHAIIGQLRRTTRRDLVQTLVEYTLPVRASRGYNYAEVTAGGVSLGEVRAGSLESRVCPGLYLVGEILDVDGRIGGFNFQWAWSSAHVVATALATRFADPQALGEDAVSV